MHWRVLVGNTIGRLAVALVLPDLIDPLVKRERASGGRGGLARSLARTLSLEVQAILPSSGKTSTHRGAQFIGLFSGLSTSAGQKNPIFIECRPCTAVSTPHSPPMRHLIRRAT
jgi:hypothetical protein